MNCLCFTDRWGAFEQFYEGEQAWEKLDLTKAQEKFKSALVQDRIKDHSSPLDLTYLNTTFGELLMMDQINRPGLAEGRLKLAQNYNPNYALAYYDLWQLYLKTGDEEKSINHQNKFKLLWQQADEDVKGIYGF